MGMDIREFRKLAEIPEAIKELRKSVDKLHATLDVGVKATTARQQPDLKSAVTASAPFVMEIPMQIDWVTPALQATLRVIEENEPEYRVRLEIIFDPKYSEGIMELIHGMPVESVVLSAMDPNHE